MIITFLSILAPILTLLLTVMVIAPVFYGAPWHPASIADIKHAFELCEAKPGEKLYDLGSGDGRVLITAARHFGLEGVGLEIDPVKAWLSKLFVIWMGVKDRVTIIRRSVYDYDYGKADILFIYMSHQALDRLFPKILNQLKPTARIICYRFCPRRMEPAKVSSDRNIFLYRLNKGGRLDEKV